MSPTIAFARTLIDAELADKGWAINDDASFSHERSPLADGSKHRSVGTRPEIGQRKAECEERLRRASRRRCSWLGQRKSSIRFARRGFLANPTVVCVIIRRHCCSTFAAVAILREGLTCHVEPNLQWLGGFRQAGAACFIWERKNNK